MKLFELHRDEDETGVSGTGRVAQGVIFDNGWCALTWLTEHTSVAFYTSIDEVVAIHGHNGLTRVVQVADIDLERVGQLCTTALQDDYEGVGVEFTSKNQRSVWIERLKFVELFRDVELGRRAS